jgi:hypothetical protein
MALSEKDINEFAQKYGITEAAVRDIAGIAAPEPIDVTAKVDSKNPGLVHFEASDGYDGLVLLDVGGSEFVEATAKKGKFKHSFSTPGTHRVRVDLGGVVRWVDVETGPNTDGGDDPVVEVPLPIGAPDFSNTLMGADDVTVEEQSEEAQEGAQGAPGGDEGSEGAPDA